MKNDNVNEKNIELVKKLHEFGKTQEEIADIVGISYSTVSRFVRGGFTMEGYKSVVKEEVERYEPTKTEIKDPVLEALAVLNKFVRDKSGRREKTRSPKPTAYKNFVKEVFKERKVDSLKKAAELWNQLTEEQKAKYV